MGLFTNFLIFKSFPSSIFLDGWYIRDTRNSLLVTQNSVAPKSAQLLQNTEQQSLIFQRLSSLYIYIHTYIQHVEILRFLLYVINIETRLAWLCLAWVRIADKRLPSPARVQSSEKLLGPQSLLRNKFILLHQRDSKICIQDKSQCTLFDRFEYFG